MSFFDIVICVDAHNYFGVEEKLFVKVSCSTFKKGGQIGIAFHGLKEEFTNGVPVELQPYLFKDVNSLHSCNW